MKIAHINIFLSSNIIGVSKKLNQQAKLAKNLGLNIDFYLINSQTSSKDALICLQSKASRLKQKFFKLSIVKELVDLSKYDLIILRYPNADFSFLTYGFAHKTITEHHTDEIKELRLYSNSIFNKARVVFTKLLDYYFLSRTRAIVGVTGEIARIQQAKQAQKNKPFFVFSNGISSKNVKKYTPKPLTNSLDLIFVASSFAPWHGLEDLISFFRRSNLELSVNLTLVGEINKNQEALINSLSIPNLQIKALGLKNTQELDLLFDNAHLAISSLSLQTKVLKEACVLKTREYTSRGIPFIYGYKDVDFTGNEAFAMFVDIQTLSFKDLLDFAHKTKNGAFLDQSVLFAQSKLDWGIKLNGLYDFCQKLKN